MSGRRGLGQKVLIDQLFQSVGATGGERVLQQTGFACRQQSGADDAVLQIADQSGL
jgi:hypothetical protein